MKRSPALRVLAVALGAALSLTACARPVATTDAGAPPLAEAGGAVLPSNHGCPTPDHGTPLPADAVLVSVDRCRSEIRAVPGDGQWEFRIDERATTNLAPLAAALRRPSEPIGAHTVCDLVLHDQPGHGQAYGGAAGSAHRASPGDRMTWMGRTGRLGRLTL